MLSGQPMMKCLCAKCSNSWMQFWDDIYRFGHIVHGCVWPHNVPFFLISNNVSYIYFSTPELQLYCNHYLLVQRNAALILRQCWLRIPDGFPCYHPKRKGMAVPTADVNKTIPCKWRGTVISDHPTSFSCWYSATLWNCSSLSQNQWLSREMKWSCELWRAKYP